MVADAPRSLALQASAAFSYERLHFLYHFTVVRCGMLIARIIGNALCGGVL